MAKYKYNKYKSDWYINGVLIDLTAKTEITSGNGSSYVYRIVYSDKTLGNTNIQFNNLLNGEFYIFQQSTAINTAISTWNSGGETYACYKINGKVYSYGANTMGGSILSKSNISKGKGSFIEEVIAEDGTFPNDGLHSDGFYYVKGALATIPINILVNGTFVDSEKAYVNVNGVWKEILEFHQVQNNKWINLLDGSINDPVGVNLLLNSNAAILGEQIAEFGFDEFEVKDNLWGRNLLHKLQDEILLSEIRDVTIENGEIHWTQKTTGTNPLGLGTYAPAGVGEHVYSFKSDNSEEIRNYINTSESGTVFGVAQINNQDNYYYININYPNIDVNDYINIYGTYPFEPIKEVKFWDLKLEKGNQATPWSPSPENLTQGYQYTLAQNLQPNQYYTFSTDYNGTWQGLWIDNKYIGYLNNGKITFKLPISINQGANVVVKILDSSFVITHAKLEEGEEATNWSLSP